MNDQIRNCFAIGTVTALALVALAPTAASGQQPATIDEPVFDFELVSSVVNGASALSQAQQSDLRVAPSSMASTVPLDGEQVAPADLGFYAVNADGEWASIDASLLMDDGQGAAGAVTQEFADISWSPNANADAYEVEINGKVVARTTENAVRAKLSEIPEANAGAVLTVNVTPMGVPDGEDAPSYGFFLTVLQEMDPVSAAETAVMDNARLAASQETATVTYYTFIPQAKLDAPPNVGVAGCEYGPGYQFGGDDRWFSSPFSVYGTSRTTLDRFLSWDHADLTPQPTSFEIAPTSVYRASDGQLVETRQLSTSDAIGDIRVIGSDPGRTWADLRVELQAGNPFCWGNSIEAAFTLELHRSGAWSIPSGQHRQMPNHEVFLKTTYATEPFRGTTIYQREYLDATCLVTLACPMATMSGHAGSI